MKVLIASSIHRDAIQKMQERHDVLCAFNAEEKVLKSSIADREVLVFRSGVQINADVLSCAPNLKLILRAGCGVDNLDLDYVRRHGIDLVRIPGPGAKAVAEMAFGLMLAQSRNLLEADRLTRQGRWAKQELTGYLLTGKTLGVVGAGNIGSRVARLGVAWGMKVLGCVEHPTSERATRFRRAGVRLRDLAHLLREADYICVHVPRKPSTMNLIDTDALARVKPSAFLVNLARGGVVSEAALYEALTQGRLRGAALDVHEAEGEGRVSPLAGLSNVILTPHIGAGTFDTQLEIGEIIVRTIEEFAAGQSTDESAAGRESSPAA